MSEVSKPTKTPNFPPSRLDDEQRLNRLARFNSERTRGLVHTEAWCDLMEDEQEWFNQRQMSEMLAQGGEEVSPGVWLVPGRQKRRWWSW